MSPRVAFVLLVLTAACGGKSRTRDGSPAEPSPPAEQASGSVYVKAHNPDAEDAFGVSMDMAVDGTTLVVGAHRESSSGEDIFDDSAPGSGAVYVYSKSGQSWVFEAFLKAESADADDALGASLALSANGNTLAIGAPFEDSSARGIDGDPADNTLGDAGAVYVFERTDEGWQRQAFVKASNSDEDDYFGISLTLSADGNTLAVGAEGEDSPSTEIDGLEDDESGYEVGAAYVFVREGGVWSQQAYIKASNAGDADRFGRVVALSGNGQFLAVGADSEDSAVIGVDGDGSDNSGTSIGAVYVYARQGASWSQQAFLKPSQLDGQGYDLFGSAVSLSQDGSVLAVGAAGTNAYSGSVFMFSRTGSTWRETARLLASNAGAGDEFGHHLRLAPSGDILLVGAAQEGSLATGVDGRADDNSGPQAGAVYLFEYSDGVWSERAYLKASNTDAGDRFGWSMAVDGSGEELVVAAPGESSASPGIGGDESDNSAPGAGAVYLLPRP